MILQWQPSIDCKVHTFRPLCSDRVRPSSTTPPIITFAMTDHPLPTVRGSYLHYTEHSIDWRSIFDEHELDTPPPSLRSLASKYGIPRATLSDRYRRYAAAKRDKDSEELAIALGEIDGRRDKHRLFSREEEQESKDQLEEQNLHPNKPIVKALALRIHQEKLESVGPVTRSQGKAASTAQFNASDGWVQRETEVGYERPQARRQEEVQEEEGRRPRTPSRSGRHLLG